MDAGAPIHPDDHTLRSYRSGKLDDASAKSVERHLESCPTCRRRAAEWSADGFPGRHRNEQTRASTSASAHVISSVNGASMRDSVKGSLPAPLSRALPHGLAGHSDYEVIRELGQGGMGVVYLAKNKLMDRLEVLKVVGSHLMNRSGVVDRFLGEIRNAAQLKHPNIVTAYAAFRLGESIVFAMEYVDGADLAELVKRSGRLPVVHACNYIHQAALGLRHAHEGRMVHRDIKPNNLMLTRQASRTIIKVLDFGLAKVSSEGTVESGLTHEGQMLGTPDYIAPEQIVDARAADIRADIYSLGCTLYYLLTGGPPFRANSLYELLQAHHSMDAMPLNLARPEVPVEVAVIVAKMMAKEPEQRFQTPAQVVVALTPFFQKASAGVEVSSAQVTRARQSHAKSPMAGAGVVPTQPTATSTPAPEPSVKTPPQSARKAVTWENLIELEETTRLNKPAPAADKWSWLVSRAWPTIVEKLNTRGPRALWPAAGVSTFAIAIVSAAIFLKVKAQEKVVFSEKLRAPSPSAKSNKGTFNPIASKEVGEVNLWPSATRASGQVLPARCRVVAMSPDCRRVAMVTAENKAMLVGEAPDASMMVKIEGHQAYIWGAAFSPDGKHLASRGNDGLVKIWDVVTGAEVRRHHIDGISIAYSHDGKQLASATGGGKVVRVWDAASGKNLVTLGTHSNWAWCAAFSPDGKRLASGSGFGNGQKDGPIVGELKIWDLETKTCTNLEGHSMRISGIAFSPDGKRLASASFDQTVKIWDLVTRKCLVTFDKHRAVAGSARFSPDGRMIASCGGDRPVRTWESESGREIANLAVLPGGRREDWFLQFSPRGHWIYSGTESRLNAWETPTGVGRPTPAHTARFLNPSLNPADVTRMVTGRWQHSPGTPAERTFGPDGAIVADGRKLGSWTLNGFTLVLTWPNPKAPGGAWLDRCELLQDGRRYEGRNQVGGQIGGVKVSE